MVWTCRFRSVNRHAAVPVPFLVGIAGSYPHLANTNPRHKTLLKHFVDGSAAETRRRATYSTDRRALVVTFERGFGHYTFSRPKLSQMRTLRVYAGKRFVIHAVQADWSRATTAAAVSP